MALRGELFRAQLVGGDDLDGKRLCVQVAKRVQLYLGDQHVVRHHHGHGAEQRLDITPVLQLQRS